MYSNFFRDFVGWEDNVSSPVSKPSILLETLISIMERKERKHVRHGHKRSHRKHRSRGDSGSVELNTGCSGPSGRLVEYSDVSSEDLSAPEAGEIHSEPEQRTPRSGRPRSLHLSHPSSPPLMPRSPSPANDHPVKARHSISKSQKHLPPSPTLSVKKRKDRKSKKDKKKKRKRTKHRSTSLDSVSIEAVSPAVYTVGDRPPLSDWEKPLSPVARNGSCSPVSPSTPPLRAPRPPPAPPRRLTNASDISHNTYSPPRTPPLHSPPR